MQNSRTLKRNAQLRLNALSDMPENDNEPINSFNWEEPGKSEAPSDLDAPARREPPPSLEIPNIKKMDARRKKKGGGFTWRWGARAGTSAGVRGASNVIGVGGTAGAAAGRAAIAGGARMAASAAAGGAARSAIARSAVIIVARGAGSAAAVRMGFLRSVAAFIARLSRTALGKAFVLGGAAAAAAVVVMLLRAAGSAKPQDGQGGVLGAIASSIRIFRGVDERGLHYAGESSQGNLKFLQPGQKGGGTPGAGDGGSPTSDGDEIGESTPEQGLSNRGGVSTVGDQMDRKYGQLSGSMQENQNSFIDTKSRFGMGLNRMDAFKKGAKDYKGAGGRMTRSGEYLKNNQLMTNARGRRLDGRNLHRLRRMYDYNPRITQTGTAETAADVAEAQFSGMEAGGAAKPPPSPVDGKIAPSSIGLDGMPQCTAPLMPTAGGCGCPEGTVQTSEGCGVPGMNVSQWSGMLDNAYAIIEDAVRTMLMAAIILLLLDIMIVIGWAVTACSGGWLGWLVLGIRVAIGAMFMSMVNAKADAVEALGEEIGGMHEGLKPISEAVTELADPIRQGASFMPIPLFGGLLATLTAVFGVIPMIKGDLQDAADESLRNMQDAAAEGALKSQAPPH